jgi:hypothetical protein
MAAIYSNGVTAGIFLASILLKEMRYTRKNAQVDAILMKTGLNNALLPTLFTLVNNIDFPKSAVRGSWKRRTFVTRKRTKFTGAFLLR